MSENLFTYTELDELASSGRMDTPIWVQFVDSGDTVVAILGWSPDKNFIAVLGVNWTEAAGNYGMETASHRSGERDVGQLIAPANKKEE